MKSTRRSRLVRNVLRAAKRHQCNGQPNTIILQQPVQTSLSFLAISLPDLKKKTFLAHLSRRLIGELIVYTCSGVRRRRSHCRCRCPPFSNVFSSETTWPIKAKFYVEPPWEGGTKVCINGHMTKMAAMPIYGLNLKKNSSPEPAGRFPRNLVCSIGDSCPS